MNNDERSEIMESIAEDEDNSSKDEPEDNATENTHSPDEDEMSTKQTRQWMILWAFRTRKKLRRNQKKGNQEVAEENIDQNEELSSDKEPVPAQEVDPKEWCQIHDEWLHLAMHAAMGNSTLQTIPDIENVKRVYQNPPTSTLALQPPRTFIW